jgi:uncharacterized phiE125 gp8 family phage protein
MPFGLTLVTAPTDPLLTSEQAKAHLSILGELDADLEADLAQRVKDATADAERECGRVFLSSVWKLTLDRFPCSSDHFGYAVIRLPLGRATAVGSIKYYDADGTLTTLSSDDYFTALNGEPARIVPKPAVSWPTLQDGRPEAVEIEFTAGWATPGDVPADLVGAVKLIMADRYFNRGDDAKAASQARPIPAAASRILVANRAHEVA